MDKLAKTYLEKMLKGCEQNIEQIIEALKNVENQVDQMQKQKEEMETASADLKKVLGIKKGPTKL
tara:strand:- start:189 stop:383 length:195 start_codon:yes stop_codon:yes gene_type:complete